MVSNHIQFVSRFEDWFSDFMVVFMFIVFIFCNRLNLILKPTSFSERESNSRDFHNDRGERGEEKGEEDEFVWVFIYKL